MTCTICLLLLLVAEAVFFTEIYKQGKKMNSLFRICTYRNVQMTINEGLRVNILCIINWLYDFCLTTPTLIWQLSKLVFHLPTAGTDSCLRADVRKYRPEVEKMNFWKNPKKIM